MGDTGINYSANWNPIPMATNRSRQTQLIASEPPENNESFRVGSPKLTRSDCHREHKSI
jgi:hypothetical protein